MVDPITAMAVANLALQGVNTLFNQGKQTEAIKLGAKSQQLALQIQSANEKKYIYKNQSEIEQQLKNLYGESRVSASTNGYDSTSMDYNLYRQAMIAEESNKETLKQIDTNLKIGLGNVKLQEYQGYAGQGIGQMSNLLNAGMQAFSSYYKGKGV